jgi:hypothetical protein
VLTRGQGRRLLKGQGGADSRAREALTRGQGSARLKSIGREILDCRTREAQQVEQDM